MDSKTTNQIIFYTLIFLLFYIFTKTGIYISSTLKTNQDITILVFGLFASGIIFLLNYNKDTFHFELTPEKECQGGPYMYSSNPEKQKLCASFSAQDLAQYECPKGFVGAPVRWRYSSISDANWKNKTCDGNFNDYSDPQVL